MSTSLIPEGLLRLDYHHTLPTALPDQSRDIQQVFLYSMWIWDDLILFILSRETIHTHCHWSQGIISLCERIGYWELLKILPREVWWKIFVFDINVNFKIQECWGLLSCCKECILFIWTVWKRWACNSHILYSKDCTWVHKHDKNCQK